MSGWYREPHDPWTDRSFYARGAILPRDLGSAKPAAVTAGPPWPWHATVAGWLYDQLRGGHDGGAWRGVESGGWLIGRSQNAYCDLELVDVVPATDDDFSTRASTDLDRAVLARVTEKLPFEETVVGDFHTHEPNAGTRPSAQDQHSAMALAEASGRGEWLSVIVCERHDDVRGCVGVDMAAYLIRRGEDGEPKYRTLDWRIK